ncbi:MAG: glycosyltransferase [Nonlabens sp.]
MKKPATILVAPLNWGLGHATRCIPIVQELLRNKYRVIIASDGEALDLLRKEFPDLQYYELPGYKIKYGRNAIITRFKLLWQALSIKQAAGEEHNKLGALLKQEDIAGVISDGRFGMHYTKITSIYITHQLIVDTGWCSRLSTWVHKRIMKNFTQIWVLDSPNEHSLAGKLSHNRSITHSKYIGAVSRFKIASLPVKYSLLVLISGPEPQRSLFYDLIIRELESYRQPVCIVRGRVEPVQEITSINNRLTYNYATSTQINELINSSNLVLCRSGYTTIMDLAKLNKKAFFIPTPGQGEQEYLATYLEATGIAPYSSQKDFKLSLLNNIDHYKGFSEIPFSTSSLEAAITAAFCRVKENSDPIPNSLST